MVEGPDHTIKLPSNVQRQLSTIHERAKADPSVSAGMPDFLGTVRAVLERLEDPVGRRRTSLTVGKFDLQNDRLPVAGRVRRLGQPRSRAGVPRQPPLRRAVLFMSGTIDGRTPASNALEVKAGFPNSWHILVDGIGHGHPQLFPQLGDVMLDFLKGKPVTTTQASLPFAFEPVRP